MKKCTVHIVGLSPYSQSRKTDHVPMKDRESHDDYDKRVWRDKCTTTADGVVAIPAMGFKQALDSVAYKLGEKVPNRRGATYKNFFASGVLCEADAPIHANGKMLKPGDAHPVTISANADGVRGSGKRVPRTFPSFSTWEAEPQFIITDDIISQSVFEQHIKSCGMIVGVGRFRPEKGGLNGRFRVTKIEWEDIVL